MTDHLSQLTMNALADGELAADQLAIVNDHLAVCPQCTSTALGQTLLKTRIAKAGHRYATPPGLPERIKRLASREGAHSNPTGSVLVSRPARSAVAGWAVAALLLVILAGTMLMLHRGRQLDLASLQNDAQDTEVFDLHVATLAAGLGPQVLSSDRHTVKPWFQGKLPFSFNLPVNLPSDTKLDGANLTYLHSQPVAQLLYSIGRHRVSVFLSERRSTDPPGESQTGHLGFRVARLGTGDFEVVAVSDVDPARLLELVRILKDAQTSQP